jgi:hypothetical protein
MNRKLYISLPLLVVILGVYCISFSRIEKYRANMFVENSIQIPSIPVMFSKFSAGEFQGLAADFFYLEAMSVLGNRRTSQLSQKDWKNIATLMRTSIGLDPYFQATYRCVQAFLPWVAKQPETGISLLKEVYKKRDWDWAVPFFIGFDYYFFLDDAETASKYLMEAARLPGSSPVLATFAARLVAESGAPQTGIQFLESLLISEQTSYERLLITNRINALKGLVQLETALRSYQTDKGSYPEQLSDLITHGYLQNMPENPDGTGYSYTNGKVAIGSLQKKRNN